MLLRTCEALATEYYMKLSITDSNASRSWWVWTSRGGNEGKVHRVKEIWPSRPMGTKSPRDLQTNQTCITFPRATV